MTNADWMYYAERMVADIESRRKFGQPTGCAMDELRAHYSAHPTEKPLYGVWRMSNEQILRRCKKLLERK